MRLLVTLLCLVSLLTVFLPLRSAHACGGCIGASVTSVESHRMAVLLSPERSVLWDQIAYSGAPEDFVWVLPVPSADVDVALADASFLDELEAQTSPIVQPRPAPVSDPAPCFGCCASEAASAQDVPSDEVTVYAQSTVGPYDTVVIGSEDGGALQEWLTNHGYPVPDEVVPVIEHYVARESVFVVLRLAPEQGVQAMQPVRVTYRGALTQFPLEMVTVGASGELGLTLWVIAEQRYEPRNYATAAIDPDDLVFDWNTTTSNYDEVFEDTLQAAGGRAWIVEQAGAFDLLGFTAPADPDLIRQTIPAAFVTRLRTRMFVDYLDEDIELGPSDDASAIDRTLVAGQELARPFDDAPPEDDGCNVQQRARAHVLLIALIAASIAWMWRPRRRSAPAPYSGSRRARRR